MATWATCGSGPLRPSIWALSPTAKASGWPGMRRSRPTSMRPPAVVFTPRTSANGLARTPAAQMSVWASITSPPPRCTRVGVILSTVAPVRTSTPRRTSVWRAWRCDAGLKGGSSSSRISSRYTRARWTSRSRKSFRAPGRTARPARRPPRPRWRRRRRPRSSVRRRRRATGRRRRPRTGRARGCAGGWRPGGCRAGSRGSRRPSTPKVLVDAPADRPAGRTAGCRRPSRETS